MKDLAPSDPVHHHTAKRPRLSELTERLRGKDRRVTGPRAAILSILHEHPHPLTNREIFEALPPGVCDLVTVYRAVHLLEDMGLVTRYDFGDGVARHEIALEGHDNHHHHLVCTACSRIVEIDQCLATEWDAMIARESGFERVTHKLEFFGRCPRCQEGPPSHDTTKTKGAATAKPCGPILE